METQTIKAADLRDGDVHVSQDGEQTRTIREPKVQDGLVHFHTDTSEGFLTFRADEDVTIRARRD